MGMDVKAGYLEKLGGTFGTTWQKRYFIIRGNSLYWYKKLTDTLHKGSVKLKGKIVKINPLRPLIMIIPTVKKEYQLKGDNKDEIESWLAAIRDVGATIEQEDTSNNSPNQVKRKSSGLLQSLKRSHSRKRSISDSSLSKEATKRNKETKGAPPIQLDLTKSIREDYIKENMSLNAHTSTADGNTTTRGGDEQTLRPTSIYDLHLKPIDPFSPVILPLNQFNNYYLCGSEGNTCEDSFYYSSSSDVNTEIQIPVLVEYVEPEEECTI